MVQRYDYSFPREPVRACKREKEKRWAGMKGKEQRDERDGESWDGRAGY